MGLGLALLGGCGEKSPARADFARQADALCAPALRQLRGVEEGIDAAGTGNDPDAIYARSAELLRRGAQITRTTFDRIEALDQPSDGRDAIAGWIAANRRQAALIQRLAAAYDAQDQKRIARLSEAVDALDRRNDATAGRLGLGRCSERVTP